jgi:hypothetical protein
MAHNELLRQHCHGYLVYLIKRLTHLVHCKEASHLLSHAQDNRLSVWETVRLRLHLYACAACRRLEQQIGFLRQAVARRR